MYAYKFASSRDTDHDDNACGFKRNICYIKCHEVVYSTHYLFLFNDICRIFVWDITWCSVKTLETLGSSGYMSR